ncbi:thioesterase II family protein [Rhizomonospora bruguierae]|uniref:thioesterase II family protein n=1 Tax=Rhizomonospora bruguierae TaxID=1581705 RepID=UPI001BCAC59B|nr:alpha/beta fold hydrolase [Micromonospora sp. NBRC 107566]
MTATVSARSRWFPFGTRPEAPVRLLTLPHAGAGAAVFRDWGRGMPEPVRVCPGQPPGREGRRAEPPFTRVGPLVRELAAEISTSVRSPYAILGHSTGALCAFEVTRELLRIGGPPPVHLFVCGRPAPQHPLARSELAGLSPPELAAFLRRLEGTPEAILSDHELLRWKQPLLVADFAVNECYTFEPDTPLNIPITAVVGRSDPGAGEELMAAWKEQTTGGFALHLLDGGHFAIFDHAPRVHATIAAALREQAVPGAPAPDRAAGGPAPQEAGQ